MKHQDSLPKKKEDGRNVSSSSADRLQNSPGSHVCSKPLHTENSCTQKLRTQKRNTMRRSVVRWATTTGASPSVSSPSPAQASSQQSGAPVPEDDLEALVRATTRVIPLVGASCCLAGVALIASCACAGTLPGHRPGSVFVRYCQRFACAPQSQRH